MTTTKISNLNPTQVAAITEVFRGGLDNSGAPVGDPRVEVTATTVTFPGGPADVEERIGCYLAATSGRGYPRQPIHSVRRRLEAMKGVTVTDDNTSPARVSPPLQIGDRWGRTPGHQYQVVELVGGGRYAVVTDGSTDLLVVAETGELVGEWS